MMIDRESEYLKRLNKDVPPLYQANTKPFLFVKSPKRSSFGRKVSNIVATGVIVVMVFAIIVMLLADRSTDVHNSALTAATEQARTAEEARLASMTPEQIRDEIAAKEFSRQAEELKREKEQELARAAAQAVIDKEFKASKPHIMKMLRDLMKMKGYIAAVAWGERFANVNDAEFQKLYSEAVRLNEIQQAGMKTKMDAKAARLSGLQNINVAVEGTHAIRYCQNLVRAELKAPGEAKFPGGTEFQVTGTNERFIVHSYVDAPNSFNAITRTPYFCRLNYNGGGRSGWNIEEFRVGE